MAAHGIHRSYIALALLLCPVVLANRVTSADTLVLYLYSDADEYRTNLAYFVHRAIKGDHRTDLHVIVQGTNNKVRHCRHRLHANAMRRTRAAG
jgi:hypothetical protein